jgi:hypothetical protein
MMKMLQTIKACHDIQTLSRQIGRFRYDVFGQNLHAVLAMCRKHAAIRGSIYGVPEIVD